MAKNPDPALKLTTSKGVTRTLDDWSTVFHLCLVILPARSEAVTGPESIVPRLLGAAAERDVTFVDPDLELVHSLGLELLPAFVLLRQDTSLVTAAEGWHPREWQRVAREVARVLAWTIPEIRRAGDPPPFAGWPVA